MSLVELIALADEQALAASGLGCLDRCMPLLGGDDVLRPLWASLADGDDWAKPLAEARDALSAPGAAAGAPVDEARELALGMLDGAPDAWTADALRAWADGCSLAALEIHRLLDTADDGTVTVAVRREGPADGASPLVAAELRHQLQTLHLLADHGTGALRQVVDLAVEGRRVLRAVVSRRARGHR